MTVLAHAGHVLVDLGVFGGPVFVLAGALLWSTHRERRRQAAQRST
jgi:2-hydroxychromene-2-carboxylate isomerase